MTAEKQVAHGTLFKIDVAGNGTFETLTLTRELTPPPREREEVDGRELATEFDVPLLGIETKSSFPVNHFWHPGDTLHEKLDTAFEANTQFPVQIVTPHTVPVTDEFEVKVQKLEPAALQPNGTYQRTVTFLRCTDITRTSGDEEEESSEESSPGD